jgi:hypothetical protein
MTVLLFSVRSGMIYSGSEPKIKQKMQQNLQCCPKVKYTVRYVGKGDLTTFKRPYILEVPLSCATGAGLISKPQVALNYGKLLGVKGKTNSSSELYNAK